VKHAIVITTTDTDSKARAMAKALVGKRLAACVQTCRISSTYRWKGKVANAKETLLLIKSRAADYQRIEREIKRIHNYDLPEIVQIPISAASKRYLAWIDASTKD
jgi:periplasmic divalent cation tolerance protein